MAWHFFGFRLARVGAAYRMQTTTVRGSQVLTEEADSGVYLLSFWPRTVLPLTLNVLLCVVFALLAQGLLAVLLATRSY